MDIQTIFLVITTVINFGWGILIFINGHNKKPNLIFSYVVFSVVLWSISMAGYRLSASYTLDWCRVLYVAAILIPLSFLYFNFTFPEGKTINKYFLAIIFLPAIMLIILTVFGNTIIADAFRVKDAENKIIFGSLYIFYVLYIIGYFSWSFIILIMNQKKYSGIVRMQSKYILIGAGSASIVAMVTNLLLPWFNIFIVNWLGQVATFLWVSFTSYAMIRYRLMDLRVILRKGVIYFISSAFVYGAFYSITWIYNKLFGGIYENEAYLLGLVFAPLFVLLFVWTNEKIKKITNKYLFFSLYNSQETMEKLADELTNSIDLGKIVGSIVSSIKEAMQLDKAGILLIDQNEEVIKYKIAKVVGFNENNGISLVQDNFLMQYLEKTQKLLVKDELQMISRDLYNEKDRKKMDQLAENMKLIEASLCLPMIISNKLIGIIVLGDKISGDAYTSEDLVLLNMLSKQAAIAVDNARLYKKVQEFNKTLQEKVDEQTKNLRIAYEAERMSKEKIDLIRIEDEALLGSIGDGVVAIDNFGKIMFINKAAEEMLRLNGKDLTGNSHREILKIETEKGEAVLDKDNPLNVALSSGKKIITSTTEGSNGPIYSYIRSDNTKFPAAIIVTPVIINGKIIGAVDVFRDMTVERQIDKSKSEFVSLASHQLRTPLTAIKWYTEILLAGKAGKISLKQKEYIEQIYHGNERMIKLINIMLNISRLEAGRLKNISIPIDIKKMIEDIIKEQEVNIKKKKLKFKFECNNDIGKILVDPDLARLIFQNIISNAIKYTPEKGNVGVKINRNGKEILFEVSDTGIGIPENQQNRIFQKLFRAENAFPHTPDGNGLGLYAAKMTTESMGGKIWFKSKINEGTTFFVVLPVK